MNYYNIGFRLEYTWDGDAHVKCPKCEQAYDVEWDSEYGDPTCGEHAIHCPNCNHDFHFSIYHKYSSW